MTDQRPTQHSTGWPSSRASRPEPSRGQRGRPGAQMAASIVVPGMPSMRREPVLGLLLFVVGVAAPLVLAAWAFRQRDDLIGVALEPRFLTLVTGVGLALVLEPPARPSPRSPTHSGTGAASSLRTAVATLVVVALCGARCSTARFRANEARSAVASVFGGGGPAIFVPDRTGGRRPRGDHERAAARGRRRPGPVGHAHRHDDPRQHPRGERPHRARVDPAQPARADWPPGTPLAARFPDGFDAYDGLDQRRVHRTSPATRC